MIDAIVNFFSVTQVGAVLTVVLLGILLSLFTLYAAARDVVVTVYDLARGAYVTAKGTGHVEFAKGWDLVLGTFMFFINVYLVILIPQALYQVVLMFIDK